MGERSAKGNLPIELSGFVGRRADADEVARLVSAARSVTLTGPGGVGKTRLALRVARRLQRGFADGVWLVELAALERPELVASTIAATLGVADRSPPSVTSTLGTFLRDRRLLLVLDNCEQLADRCAELVGEMLKAAPGLRVLATSRHPLRVDGEHVVTVAPLSVPDEDQPPPLVDLIEFDAVRLFVERARAVAQGFEVTAENRAAVAALCRRLDGIPLAIELAAARLRVLSVEQIVERLDDRFELLTRGARTAPTRHQTLQAAFDWSFALCSPAERLLWARLSVFAGGFDLDAAEQVCAGDGLHRHEVFELVGSLIDKSVLIREPGTGAPAYYKVLETVRQYGQQRLAASGEAAALWSRHGDFFADMARRVWADLFSPREVDRFIWVNREHPNLRVALQHCLTEPGKADAGLEAVLALHDVWTGTGRHREELHWLTRFLALDPRPDPRRAMALAHAGYLHATLGELDTGKQLLAQARELAAPIGDPGVHAEVAYNVGLTGLYEPRPDLARVLTTAREALDCFRLLGDDRRVSTVLMQLATTAAFSDDPRADAYAEESARLCAAGGAQWLESWALTILSLVRWRQDERGAVPDLLRRALQIKQMVPDPWGTGMCLEILAWNAGAVGRHRHAARLLGACHALRRFTGSALADRGLFRGYHEACEATAREILGDAGYTAAFDDGASLTLAGAISCALDEPAGKRAVPRRGKPGDLTRRERQAAGLVAEGLTNKDIAARLGIAPRTAESHVENILSKLGFTNRAQLAAWATARHLAPGAAHPQRAGGTTARG
ncbi:MAG TPA: LuxR C-terminal-related transcriptional regulator [Catenuloplanes sp.]|jgi:predicted ATPase/DNA-binding CsgD family transcriptional regulator